jgi:hypothetical protein
VGEGMLERVKYTMKFIFAMPKGEPESKAFRINYGKYYTKKESFTMLMWSFTLLALTGECLVMSLFFYGDLIRWLFIGSLVFFYIISMKNVSRIRAKYKKKAIEEGSYG